MKIDNDISIELTSSSKELGSTRKGDERLPINYLFSFDTSSASNHCCLRMMKAAKTCLLQSGFNVAGCFITIKNKGCLETKGENSVNLDCYRHLERENNWIPSTVPGEMIYQSFMQESKRIDTFLKESHGEEITLIHVVDLLDAIINDEGLQKIGNR